MVRNVLLVVALGLLACRREAPAPAPASHQSALAERAAMPQEPDAAAEAGPGLVVNGSAVMSPLVPLKVPGWEDAVLVAPLGGAPAPRPVLVDAHGLWDRPEWHCEAIQYLAAHRAFVLCPRGKRTSPPNDPDPRLSYSGAAALFREMEAGLDALQAQLGPAVDVKEAVFVGMSLGSILAGQALHQHASRFPRAMLVEGGFTWSAEQARAFARGGGKSILFLCGQPNCADGARASVRVLQAAGVEARLHYVKGGGHNYGGRMYGSVAAKDFEDLVRPDPRWGERRWPL